MNLTNVSLFETNLYFFFCVLFEISYAVIQFCVILKPSSLSNFGLIHNFCLGYRVFHPNCAFISLFFWLVDSIFSLEHQSMGHAVNPTWLRSKVHPNGSSKYLYSWFITYPNKHQPGRHGMLLQELRNLVL